MPSTPGFRRSIKLQDPETQLRPLHEHAQRRGFAIAVEFVDHASGRDNARSEYGKLLDAARRWDLDVVLVWRYDRFARSTHALINALTEFHSLGVDFISLQEGTDTTTAQGKLVFTIMAGHAEFERALISERVTAGMARARTEGNHIGRPPVDPKTIEQMRLLRRQGRSYSDIQKACRGVGRSTVVKYTRGVRRATRSRRSGTGNFGSSAVRVQPIRRR